MSKLTSLGDSETGSLQNDSTETDNELGTNGMTHTTSDDSMDGRLKRLTDADMDDAQRAVAARMIGSKTGQIIGPMNAWLRSPLLAERAFALGDYARHGSGHEKCASELVIGMTAGHW